MSHILLLPFGTAGSVYPLIWLGRLLRERGHQVTLITAGRYEGVAVKAGLSFQGAGDDELENMLDDPKL